MAAPGRGRGVRKVGGVANLGKATAFLLERFSIALNDFSGFAGYSSGIFMGF